MPGQGIEPRPVKIGGLYLPRLSLRHLLFQLPNQHGEAGVFVTAYVAGPRAAHCRARFDGNYRAGKDVRNPCLCQARGRFR
jgi:hypothetical protein